MKLILGTLVVILATTPLHHIEGFLDSNLQQLCKQLPRGASYEEMCKDFW